MKKYRIEVEKRAVRPRPWEWRAWTRNTDGTFDADADCDIAGSAQSVTDAFEEAMGMLELSEAPERTYSVCPKSATGLHEFMNVPGAFAPNPLSPSFASTNVVDGLNAICLPDMQCRLCGKLYSEHVT